MNADEQIRQDREILRAASKDSDDWDDATWAAWWRTAERHDPHFKRKVTTAAAVAAQGALPAGPSRSTDDVLADYAALDFAALMDPDAAAVVTAVCDPLAAEIKRLKAALDKLRAVAQRPPIPVPDCAEEAS